VLVLGSKVFDELTADLHIGNAGQDGSWHELSSQCPPLRTANTVNAAGAPMSAMPVNPSPRDESSHGKAKKIDRFMGPKALLNLLIELAR